MSSSARDSRQTLGEREGEGKRLKVHLVVEALVPRERSDEVRGDGAAEHVQLRGVRVRVARAPDVEAPPAERDAEFVARHYAPLRAAPARRATHTDSTGFSNELEQSQRTGLHRESSGLRILL